MRRVRGAAGGTLAAVLALLVVSVPSGGASDDPLRNLQYGLDRVEAETAWVRARGAGTMIAIVDTGVDTLHEDLRDRIVAGRDFVDSDDDPRDENGHGTHVAGVAAAATDNGRGVAGVAPDAMLMPLRVLDPDGTGVESNVVEAIRFAVRRSQDLGTRLVLNLSLTDLQVEESPASSTRIQEAIREAWQAGAVVVAAAGNENLSYSDYPAAGPNVLAVGATDGEDRRAGFSNLNPTVVAPGEKIVSTYWDPSTPDDHAVYASGSGTSMAAPHVSGLAALLLSTGMDNARTVERIIETADDLGAAGPDPEFGFGRINVARALGAGGGAVAGEAPPESVPLAAEGRFEPIRTPAPDGGSLAAGEPGRSEVPSKTIPATAAAFLATLAYAAIRWNEVEAEADRRRRPGPWEG